MKITIGNISYHHGLKITSWLSLTVADWTPNNKTGWSNRTQLSLISIIDSLGNKQVVWLAINTPFSVFTQFPFSEHGIPANAHHCYNVDKVVTKLYLKLIHPWTPILIARPSNNNVMYTTAGYNIVTTLWQCHIYMYNVTTTTA